MTRNALTALRTGRLAGVRELNLAGLGLTEVPAELFGLADTLEVLDLAGNTLRGLPDDLARLTRLRVLFVSGNPIARLPPVLGACPALSQIGARGCGLREIPDDALPPTLRWLTATDNALEDLPDSLGRRPLLQKLMLAGNGLRTLPESLAGAENLELVRLAANRFETLPSWLAALPRLAWLAWSGNPLDSPAPRAISPRAISPRAISWSALAVGDDLGQGASGRVKAASWCDEDGRTRPVAVKVFKGAMTSDGLPAREMAGCLAAGTHRNLAGGLGFVPDHPEGRDALVMERLPEHWRELAGPPSLETCSRDVFDPRLRFSPEVALRLATGMARAGAHLRDRGLLHGDVYAHNILWDGRCGEAALGDFGAASFLLPAMSDALPSLDVLAFGILLGELLDRTEADDVELRALHRACTGIVPASRPSFRDIVGELDKHSS